MNKVLLLASIFALTSCSAIKSVLFVAKYDTNEYELVNWIRTTAELSVDSCLDAEVSKQNFISLYKATAEFKNFTQYLKNNSDSHESASSLHSLVDRGLDMYTENATVSPAFCEISLKQIADSAEVIQQTLGSKPL